MTAADRLAAIRARDDLDRELGRHSDDVRRMADALDAVLALHTSDRCDACERTQPCPTVAAITDALGGES